MLDNFVKYIPFTYIWLVKVLVGKPRSVLDIGCGDGSFMSAVMDDNWEITGIDIHRKTANAAKRSGIYKNVFVGDLIKVCKKLVKQNKKYDLVFSSQVIEHITNKEGGELLDLMDKLYNKKIYIGTPRGYLKQGEEHVKENKYQDHKSGWYEKDFQDRGYTVYGVGLSFIWSEDGVVRNTNIFIRYILVLTSFVFSPITFFIPKLASGLIAIKSK